MRIQNGFKLLEHVVSTCLVVIDESTKLVINRSGLQILILEELKRGETRLGDAVDGLHDRPHDERIVLNDVIITLLYYIKVRD